MSCLVPTWSRGLRRTFGSWLSQCCRDLLLEPFPMFLVLSASWSVILRFHLELCCCQNEKIKSFEVYVYEIWIQVCLTSDQSAIWNWLIFKNCRIQRLSSNLFEKQHADALLRPSTEMQLKEVQTIFLAVVITIIHCTVSRALAVVGAFHSTGSGTKKV